MVWIVVLGLVVWAFFQAAKLSDHERRLDILRRELEALRREPAPPPSKMETPPAPAPVVAPPAPEPVAAPRAATPTLPERLAARVAEAPPPPPRVVRPERPPINLAAWMSENGLAWLGGGALALGGIFLVTYAAQRGVFTPLLRIWAAVVAGAAMLAASEWIRRIEGKDGRAQALPAAVAAGAGASTLYGAVWAAEGLYHFIGPGTAAPLLAVISLGLLGLAWLHGGPLALLALGGAFLVPAITGPAGWGDASLLAYLGLVTVTGYAAAGARRWGSAGLLAGFGAVVWSLVERGLDQHAAVALLVGAPPILALAALEWSRRRGPETPPSQALSAMFPAALIAASVAAPLLWVISHRAATDHTAVAVSLAAIAAASFAAVRRHAPPPLQAVAYALALAGLVVAAATGAEFKRPDFAIEALAVALAIAGAGLAAGLTGKAPRDRLWAASGAVVSALVFSLTAAILWRVWPVAPWAGPAAGAAVLALGAALMARRSADTSGDLAVALWVWAATGVSLHALDLAFDPRALPVVFAAAAVAGAGLQMRLGWRGLPSASLASALAALAALLGPALGGAALLGHADPLLIAGVAAASAALVAAVAIPARRGAHGRRDVADALTSGAILIGLTGAFLALHAYAAPAAGARLDALTEAALRSLMLLAAGLLARPGPGAGPLSRLRPHALLLAGFAHALLVGVLGLNPLWSGVPVAGPPILDSLALAYLVPALLFAAAARTGREARWAPLYAAFALGFGLIWGLEEIRRFCQGPDFARALDVLGRVEAAADALLLLAVACGLFALAARARRGAGILAQTASDWAGLPAAYALAALVLADLAYGYLASPWWGPVDRPLTSGLNAAALFACYAGGVVASFGLWRLAAAATARFALVSAVLQLFVLVTLLVRFAFRGLAMHPSNAEARIETWAFSAVWALYGLTVMVVGVRRSDIALRWTGLGLLLFTTAKVLLFDMAHLDGMVRAASFLALGALLIVGALAARRMGAFGQAKANAED